MSFIIRAARESDLSHMYEMAKRTGGGFTNLPPDKKALTAKLERGAAGFARAGDDLSDDLYVFMLENTETGQVTGTCQIFGQVGQKWPFYSYRISTHSQHSQELDRTFRAEILNLTTDLEGSSEVGGLFLSPSERSGGHGMLLARSRYLFIRNHRSRFADKTLAELRGVIDESGGSPFWDGVAGRFFGMNFQEADQFNAIHGNQFIADLMPNHPVYIAMLPESARHVIGIPHPTGRAAMRMLEEEGFRWEKYIDIFDGGPTMTAHTDDIRGVREAKDGVIVAIDDGLGEHKQGVKMLVARGELADFVCTYGWIDMRDDGLALDPDAAKLLGVDTGDSITYVARW